MRKKDIFRNGNAFLVVPVILISVFVFIPMVYALITSFQTGLPLAMKFDGFANYKRLLSDQMFLKAFTNTFIFLLFQVPIMLFLAIIISNFLNDKKLKFKGVFRTAIFLPCITSMVSYSLIMKTLFAPNGVVNNFLMNIHLISTPIGWLTDPVWAKVLIILAITWRWTGYNMIFFLSGMQNINPEIYEAASLDGATKWQQLIKITIPNLKPIILFTGITSTIGTLQLFDEVVNITNGGPANATSTLSFYIYNLSFRYTPDFGYAAAVSFVIVFFTVILSIIQTKLGGDK
ncbi:MULTISPECIES: carbohydrate ABC transporter permease [unclassified Lactococcus]|uniref:carbohydrate ABC transporter permease n=1 Tax=unclassified Lactococcus TaxID=2643510 RepID=UPI0011C9259F|nr:MULTISPECIES: sugar ABC transporter permease [unclassified Lactococcus]MQW22531.1 ABC transporter permease subunit [Lactococcus sp. dk101]TXK45555.1 sugar ABC transporter permease [Lactococcus sp. dk310]TXK51405.1 sugar ABC transporter permease [Lactococcus sp. dk322]